MIKPQKCNKKIIKAHAVKEAIKYSDDFDYFIEEIKRNGYTIIPNLIEDDSLKIIGEKIHNIYNMQMEEIGGEDNLNIIHDQGFVMSLLSSILFSLILLLIICAWMLLSTF